jgi:glycosyltransferase 2 family protein
MRMGWLRLLVPLALLAGLLWWLDPGEVAASILRLSGPVVVAAFLIAFADRVLMAYKWRQLVLAGGGSFSFLDALRIQFQAGVSARVVPVAIGGDLLRAWLAVRCGVSKGLALGAITIEKGIAMLSSVLLALGGLILLSEAMPAGTDGPLLIGSALVILFAGAVGLWLLFHPRAHRAGGRVLARVTRTRAIPERLVLLPEKVSRALLRFRSRPGALALHAVLALAEHLLQILKLVVLGIGVGIALPLLSLFAITAVALFVRRVAGLLESWGLGEGGAILVFALLGVPGEQAVALLVANFAVSTITVLPGILFFYTHPVRSPAEAGDAHDAA